MLLNEIQYFIVRYALDGRERVEKSKKFFSSLQIATCQLSNDHRMACNLVSQQQFAEAVMAIPQVVDPYRSVDKDHDGILRRGIGRNPRSDLPSLASLIALARAIRASSPM